MENERTNRIETFLYDADGNRTEDESLAVRAVTVEVDDDGNVVREHAHDSLGWKVDPISLEGDAGELATRPKHDD
jgi:YD repeat-containing protein